MNTDTRDQQAEAAPTTPSQPNVVPLERVVDAVKQDSQREPERYLDETVTKYGGE